MKRLQEASIKKDLKEKYIFLAGPRQVGKTTLSKQLFQKNEFQYLNYDLAEDRVQISKGEWDRESSLVILDEFHKFPHWKTFLKGYYDTEGLPPPILVTGSAKLNVFKKGNDSMVGRYYYHRLLPYSLKELANKENKDEVLDSLLRFGNFPEPFKKASVTASKRWQNNYLNRVIREDVTDLSNVRDLPKIQLLVDLLRGRVGSTVSYASLARDLQIAPKTVKEWIALLEQLFVIFIVTPYHKNVARSLLKEPKIYFYDATMAFDKSAHLENLVAVSLLKHIYFINDTLGDRGALYYLRTKDGKEIDFALEKNRAVTHLIEVKHSDHTLASSFSHFNKYFLAAKKLQLVLNLKKPRTVMGVQVKKIADFLWQLDI